MCEHSWRLRGYHWPRQQSVVEVGFPNPPPASLCAGKGVCRDSPFAYPQQEAPGLHIQVLGGLRRSEPFGFCREHAGCRTRRSHRERCRSHFVLVHHASRMETATGSPRSLKPSSSRTASTAAYGSAKVTVADINVRSPSLHSRIPISRTRPNLLHDKFSDELYGHRDGVRAICQRKLLARYPVLFLSGAAPPIPLRHRGRTFSVETQRD